MIKSETNWLSNETQCECCGDTTTIGNLIVDADGDNICEDCYDVIEIANEQETK